MKIKSLILMTFILMLSFVNVNAKAIEDDNLELKIEQLYIEIIKDSTDEVVSFKEITDYTYNPVIKTETNEHLSNNDITVINLNLKFENDIKELIKNNILSDKDGNLTGRLIIKYKLNLKNDRFKSIYNINKFAINRFDSDIDYFNDKKVVNMVNFNSEITETLYMAYCAYEGDELKVFDSIGANNYILLSQNLSENLDLTVNDRIYYIYDDLDDDKDEIYDETYIFRSALLFIDVEDNKGKAEIKGLSLYSGNTICEIYRSEENLDNYIHIGNVKCDGEDVFIDNVEPGKYDYKLKDKNIGIFSDVEYANLTDEDDYINPFAGPDLGFKEYAFILIIFLLSVAIRLIPIGLIVLFVVFILKRRKNKVKDVKKTKKK